MSDAAPKQAGRQFLAFVLVGGVAAAVNWGARYALSSMGLALTPAIILAYAIGMGTAYVLSRFLVFEKSGRAVSGEVMRFTMVNIVSAAQVWLVTVVLDRFVLPGLGWTWHPQEIAHAIGVASPIATSYFGHKYFTFTRGAANASAAPDTATDRDTPP